MFKKILEKIKAFFIAPVSTIKEVVNVEAMKTTLIKAGVIIVTLPLIETITQYFKLSKTITKDTIGYSRRTDAEIAEANKKLVEDAKLFEGFFKQILTYAIIIIVITAVFYVIGKLLKKSPDYKKLFVLSTNYMMLNAVIMLISKIVMPMSFTSSLVVLVAGMFYTQLIVIFALKDILEAESTEKYITMTAIVYAVTLIIAIFAISGIVGVNFDNTYKQFESIVSGASTIKNSAGSILNNFNF